MVLSRIGFACVRVDTPEHFRIIMQPVALVTEATKSQPAITALALLLLAIMLQWLKELRLWLGWFCPAAGPHTEVRVTVDARDPPTSQATSDLPTSQAAAAAPPTASTWPRVALSGHPEPRLRRAGSATCSHDFHVKVRNQYGYNYECRKCREQWYRHWPENEAEIPVGQRPCFMLALTDVQL